MSIKIEPDGSGVNRGIEGVYYEDTKHLHLQPTNSQYDWIMNVVGWVLGLGIVNIVWLIEVIQFHIYFHKKYEYTVDSISGHSKGGTQATYLRLLFHRASKLCVFGAFPPYAFFKISGTLVVKFGDFVPLLSGYRYTECIVTTTELLPISSAHYWSLSGIEAYIDVWRAKWTK